VGLGEPRCNITKVATLLPAVLGPRLLKCDFAASPKTWSLSVLHSFLRAVELSCHKLCDLNDKSPKSRGQQGCEAVTGIPSPVALPASDSDWW
jgi:hypothetical protein